MRATLLLLAVLVACATSDEATWDCKMRQLGVDFAQKLQPFRPASVFQEVADALNGSPEAKNCSVSPSATAPMLKLDRPAAAAGGNVLYVDANEGSDSNSGSITAPLKTIGKAVTVSESFSGAKTIYLRAGTFYLPETLQLGVQDSGLLISAYNNEEVWISGGVPIPQPQWKPYNVTHQWNVYPGQNAFYNDNTPQPGVLEKYGDTSSAAACEAACQANSSCNVWIWVDATGGTWAKQCWFRFDGVLTLTPQADCTSGALNSKNVYVAEVASLGITSIPGLRQDGARLIRARYPNANPEIGFGSSLQAKSWVAGPKPPGPSVEVNLPTPLRNDSTQGYFQNFQLGIGGSCDMYSPPAGFWCGNMTTRGDYLPQAPAGLVATQAQLPNSPYANTQQMVVQAWRQDRWFSWMFEVSAFDVSSWTYTFGKGGFQGAEGCTVGDSFYVENVFEELDFPGEWFYNETSGLLYLYYNGTDAPPSSTQFVATNLQVLVNVTGSQASPVADVSFVGIGFRDAALTYFEPHGLPSGGDWALARTGAVFLQGTENVTITQCTFTRLDGVALFLNGYNRGAEISYSEFSWIGESAIAQWGLTDGVDAVPGFGPDGTAGNQPRGTQVLYNYGHELGIWEKQSSFFFQAQSAQTLLLGNIFFNGPRAGINFNDGFGGGSNMTYNILFNTCRESGDHGPFNSWDRQVYVTDVATGSPSVIKAWDDLSHNFIIANYDGQEGIDNDDGSCYYHTHHNVMSYSGGGMKSDFGGHDNIHHNNLYAWVGKGLGINSQLPGHLDGFYNNTVVLQGDSATGSFACSGDGVPILHDNTWYSPTGNVSECGMPLAKFQAQSGLDPGSTAAPYPSDDVLITLAQQLLGL